MLNQVFTLFGDTADSSANAAHVRIISSMKDSHAVTARTTGGAFEYFELA